MWCWLLLLLFLTSMEVFHIIAFRRHPSPFRGLSLGFLHPILYFQPSPSQSDSQHFHFNVSRFFILTGSATVLSERFLLMGVFTLYSFVCDSGEGRNTPSRILLCACPHRVVSFSWRMDLNYWCLNYKTIDISIVPVSHEV